MFKLFSSKLFKERTTIFPLINSSNILISFSFIIFFDNLVIGLIRVAITLCKTVFSLELIALFKESSSAIESNE